MGGHILRVTGLSKSFGALAALDGVDAEIQKGLIHGIIGPNGSGKTTLFNCITGLLSPDSGSIVFDSEDITRRRPERIARKGIRRTFQGGELVPGLTVLENVMTGINDGIGLAAIDAVFRLPFVRSARETWIEARARRMLQRVGMHGSADRWGLELSWAERQLVQMARALVAEPKLLLLDEPASGMGAEAAGKVGEVIRRTRDDGITVVVVSHDVGMLMDLSDRVTVLNFGRKIAEGAPEDIRNDPRVREAYLGAG